MPVVEGERPRRARVRPRSRRASRCCRPSGPLPLSGSIVSVAPGSPPYRGEGGTDPEQPGRDQRGDRAGPGACPGPPSPGSTSRPTAARCCGTPPRHRARPTRRAWSCSRRSSAPPTSTRSRPTSRSSPPASRSVSACSWRAGSSTATGDRSGTSWSRSGRPTPAAGTATRAISTRHRWTRTSPASGRCLTDHDGYYRFVTIKPGPYPWRNHHNAWRPAHIHFSLFGTEFTQRLVTQMYFPGDPLFALDPIYQSITDQRGPRPAGRRRTTTT